VDLIIVNAGAQNVRRAQARGADALRCRTPGNVPILAIVDFDDRASGW
jgi:hypothetical protein